MKSGDVVSEICILLDKASHILFVSLYGSSLLADFVLEELVFNSGFVRTIHRQRTVFIVND